MGTKIGDILETVEDFHNAPVGTVVAAPDYPSAESAVKALGGGWFIVGSISPYGNKEIAERGAFEVVAVYEHDL